MDYIQLYVNEKGLELSPVTVHNYETGLRRFERFVGKPLDEVSKNDVLSYINHMQNVRRLKRSSIATLTTDVKSFYRWMQDEEHVGANPTRKVKTPRVEKRLPIYLTLSEMRSLVEAASVVPEDERLVKMLYSTGVRISELVQIKKRDVDESGNIKIFGKGSKERMVSIHPAYLPMFQTYMGTLKPDEPLFPYSVDKYEKDIVVLAARARIEKHITPHKLRHTFASAMYGATHDILAVQISVGHSSLNTTQVYTHLEGDTVQKKQNMLPEVK